MMILAGVSLSMLFGESGIVTQARKATAEYERQAKIEKVIAEIQFNLNTAGKKIKGKTAEELAIAIVDNGLKIEEVAVLYETKDGQERIVYKYNEDRTREERIKLESDGIYLLKGDTNNDGIIDEKDVEILKDISLGIPTEYNISVCDLNSDGRVNSADVSCLMAIIEGYTKFSELTSQSIDPTFLNVNQRAIAIRCIIDEIYYSKYEKYLLDSDGIITYLDKNTNTGHVMYRYDLATKEEREIIESVDEFKTNAGYYIGVNMLKGDANLDGSFTLNDINLIEKNISENIDFTSTQTTIIDMNNNNKVDETDIEILLKVLNGEEPMYPEWAE